MDNKTTQVVESILNPTPSQETASLSLEINEPKINITVEQLNNIKKITFKNGEFLMNNNDIYYEVVNRIINQGYDTIYTFLTNKIWNDKEDLYFSLPEFESSKYKYNKFIEEQFMTRDVVEGLYICKNVACKSNKTESYTIQMRSRDEGETVVVRCTACGTFWQIRS